jgi:multiple sugar transport system substrate-binding protein
VLQSPEFLENTPYNKAFAESMGFVKDFWAVPVYGEMMQTGQAELHKFIVEGEGTAQGTLDNIAKTHEDILKKGGLLK